MLAAGGSRRESLREVARIELGLRHFLEQTGSHAFTDTFEDLHGLAQLPGLAAQRLMADGYGFGAEGDWKTAALVRAVKVMSHGLEGGASFMEDYTYHLGKNGQVLGAHMLEVCPSIAAGKLSVEVHPLAIGGKQDPVRLVFTAASGKAVNASVVELANRFRMIVNPVTLMPPEHPLPALPVARAVWVPEPNLKIAATAWILAGGSHHTALSPALTPEHLENFAAMAGMEYLLIDADTKLADFTRELRWNDLYYQQILHHRFELAIVEEVAHCRSAADLRNLDGRPSQLANVSKRSIPLIQKQQLGLKVLEPGMKAVDLGIYMSVDQEKILPAIVVEIDKRISPPHIASGALRNSRSNRDIGKSQVPVIAIEGGILVVKVRNQQRHAPSMQKVAQGNSHIGFGQRRRRRAPHRKKNRHPRIFPRQPPDKDRSAGRRL